MARRAKKRSTKFWYVGILALAISYLIAAGVCFVGAYLLVGFGRYFCIAIGLAFLTLSFFLRNGVYESKKAKKIKAEVLKEALRAYESDVNRWGDSMD